MNPPAASLSDLVERHHSEILAYLVRFVGNPHDAQDVCQEVFLRAHRAFGRLRPDSNARAWLYRIATRSALNERRRSRRSRDRVDLSVDTLPASALSAPDRRAELRTVALAVRALPSRQRAALMLRLFQGLDYGEIAASLGGNAAAARANVYQAIRKLRATLRGE